MFNIKGKGLLLNMISAYPAAAQRSLWMAQNCSDDAKQQGQ